MLNFRFRTIFYLRSKPNSFLFQIYFWFVCVSFAWIFNFPIFCHLGGIHQVHWVFFAGYSNPQPKTTRSGGPHNFGYLWLACPLRPSFTYCPILKLTLRCNAFSCFLLHCFTIWHFYSFSDICRCFIILFNLLEVYTDAIYFYGFGHIFFTIFKLYQTLWSLFSLSVIFFLPTASIF